ncbi:MAG: glycosyltransferase family 9 protein [Acidobacteriota bacterium]
MQFSTDLSTASVDVLAPRSRILIVKLGALGDVVYTLPLLHRLRAALPEAFIAWAVEPRARAIVDGHPELDAAIVLDRSRGPAGFWRFLRQIRALRFDAAIDAQRLLKSGAIAAISGSRLRAGFDRARSKELSFLFTNRRTPGLPAPRHMVEQYLELGDLLGLPPVETRFVLPAPLTSTAAPADAEVLIGIGAGKPANRWPVASWARLVEGLEATGRSIALVGGGTLEQRTAAEIRAATKAPFVDLVGRTTIAEVAALLSRARLHVGLDSGITHLACALGKPVVAIYGAADERRTGPWGPRARIVRRRPSCSPCGRRQCPLGTIACMRDLSAQEVLQAARDALDRS